MLDLKTNAKLLDQAIEQSLNEIRAYLTPKLLAEIKIKFPTMSMDDLDLQFSAKEYIFINQGTLFNEDNQPIEVNDFKGGRFFCDCDLHFMPWVMARSRYQCMGGIKTVADKVKILKKLGELRSPKGARSAQN